MSDVALETLLTILADGQEHTAGELCARLAVEPTRLAQVVQTWLDLGLGLRSLSNGNYCLAESLELLDRQRIMANLSEEARARLSCLEVYQLLDSTNT